jgi:gamma-glutamylcyclotransferase (GGCT)/AIG2-like uncharacterized protein YtfP
VVEVAQRIIVLVTTESDLLFVYGSLKRGARHHAELRGARFVGVARTVEGYRLEAIGEYLALVERPGLPGTVSGELFEVDQALLLLLDEFEGDDYRRGVVRLTPLVAAPAVVSQATDKSDSPGISLALAYLKRTR